MNEEVNVYVAYDETHNDWTLIMTYREHEIAPMLINVLEHFSSEADAQEVLDTMKAVEDMEV
jgi:hypothetical protein